MIEMMEPQINQIKNPILKWLSLFGLVELLWFGMLYPLLPKTALGWFVCVISGALLGGWFFISSLLIKWLQQQVRFKFICKVLAVIVAIHLGVVFWVSTLYWHQFIQANFSYFGR